MCTYLGRSMKCFCSFLFLSVPGIGRVEILQMCLLTAVRLSRSLRYFDQTGSEAGHVCKRNRGIWYIRRELRHTYIVYQHRT